MRTLVLSLATATLFAGTTVSSVAADTSSDLVPFRAIYNLHVPPPPSGSPFSGGSGTLNRSLEKTCEGWINAETMALSLNTRVGGQLSQDVRFASWEALDSTAYRFASRIKFNTGEEQKKGKATLKALGEAGEVTYQVPEEGPKLLPAGTRFPLDQVRYLLETAQAGGKVIDMLTFDGTEDEGAEPTSGLVLKRLEASPSELGEVASGPGWRYTLAFYPPGDQQTTPTFQLTLDLLDNGIPKAITLEFETFTLIQTLTEVEALERPAC